MQWTHVFIIFLLGKNRQNQQSVKQSVEQKEDIFEIAHSLRKCSCNMQINQVLKIQYFGICIYRCIDSSEVCVCANENSTLKLLI